LAFNVAMTAQTDAPPDPAEQERIVTLMRGYAANYRVPDLAFERKDTEFHGAIRADKWHRFHTSCTSRFAHDGEEYWRPSRENCQPIPSERWRKAGWYEGVRVGGVDVLKPLATADTAWDRWVTLQGHRLSTFRYSVSVNHSKWVPSEVLGGGGSARVPYSGSVSVDPSTGAIWRVAYAITEIPVAFKARNIVGADDYTEMTIGDARFMLKVHSTETTSYSVPYRYEFVFLDYHRFQADSSITFAPQ
jgi:hypothetical protein